MRWYKDNDNLIVTKRKNPNIIQKILNNTLYIDITICYDKDGKRLWTTKSIARKIKPMVVRI